MSTYFNEETGRYENFENEVAYLLKDVADSLSSQSGEGISVVAGVRYDTDDQGLTETEQGNARTNIAAAAAADLTTLETTVGGLGDVAAVAVTYGTQELTDEQKAAARGNIGAEQASGVEIIPETAGYIRVESPASATSVALTDGEPTITNSSETSTFKARYSLLEVEEGEKYTVIVRGLGSSTPGMLVIAADGTILDRQTGSTYANEQRRVVTIPEGAKWLYVVRNASNSTSANGRTNRFWIGAYTQLRLDNLEATVADNAVAEETVSGSEVTITANKNTSYVCSASSVTSLTFTPCNSGLCEVRFNSGTTPTALTVPNTVKWPDWFNPSSLAASTTYDIMIKDGVFGAVMMWA